MEKSSIKLISNIMLKSEFDKNPQIYLPFDMLPSYYCDVRCERFLTKQQLKQVKKRLYLAEKIIEDNDD